MEQDLIEAKKYLSQQGYGSGTNYTTNLVAVLLANYAQEQVKKFHLGAVMPLLPNGKRVLAALKEFSDSLTDEEKEQMFGNEA